MSEEIPKLDYQCVLDKTPSLSLSLSAVICGMTAALALAFGYVDPSSYQAAAALAVFLGILAGLMGLLGLVSGRSRLHRFGILFALMGSSLGAGVAAVSFVAPAPRPKWVDFTVDFTEPRCVQNLLRIGRGMSLFANDHGGRYPDTFSELLFSEDLVTSEFMCPSTSDTPAPVAADLMSGGHLSYVYLGKGFAAPSPATQILAYEPLGNHQNGSNFLFGDGRVEFFLNKKATKVVGELDAGFNPPRPEKVR